MSTFLGDLTVTQLRPPRRRTKDEPIPAKGAWRLFRVAGNDLILDLGGGRTIVVPVGFITDGPSIPRLFWNIVPVWGPWAIAGIIHDFVCCLLAMGRPHEECQTRYECDRMFVDAMWSIDVPARWVFVLWLGVCFGRWFNVRTTMVDFNVKLSAILDARIQESTPAAVARAEKAPGGGDTALPLIRDDHPHTFEALNADPNRIVSDPVAEAKAQAQAA